MEKCHIVAKALGGPYEPSNIFLLCGNCHIESLDTVYPDIFFKWIAFKRKRCDLGVDRIELGRRLQDILDLYEVRDLNDFLAYLDEELFKELGSATNFKKFSEINSSFAERQGLSDKIIAHFGEGVSSYSTIMLIVRNYCNSRDLL